MSTPEEIFTELQDRFSYEKPITELIISKGLTTLAEFSHYCNDTADVVATFITPIATKLTNERLMGARLKMAWTAVVAGEKAKETASIEGVVLDEEELLPATSLANIKGAFFKRYHWMPPPEQQPSDKLLSKLSRALQKKSLEVMSVHNVKTLFNQRSSTSKRMKVAQNLWVGSVGDEDVAAPVEDWNAYSEHLLVYLIGLAMVGATPVSPSPATPESLATDTTDYVQFPCNLAWRYHARAVQCAKRYPETNRLAVVSSLDLHERAEWAQRFANSDETLGKVVQKIYLERATHWAQTPLVGAAGHVSARPPEPEFPPSAPAASLPKPSSKLATELRDGQPLCAAWQRGKCSQQSARDCPQGQHRCAHKLRSGRVCGDSKHLGTKCNNKLKA